MKRKSSAPIRSDIRAAIYLAPYGFTWKVTGLSTRERLRRAAWELGIKLTTKASEEGPSVFLITKAQKFSRLKEIPVTKLLKQTASKYLPIDLMPIDEDPDGDFMVYDPNNEQTFREVV
jgi:hypothetical protein